MFPFYAHENARKLEFNRVSDIPFKDNPSLANFSILYPLKTQENQKFYGGLTRENWPQVG